MEESSGDDCNVMLHPPPFPPPPVPWPEEPGGAGREGGQRGAQAAAKWDLQFVVKSLVAGGLAGMVAKSSVAPLDRIKILLQAQSPQYKHLGVFSGMSAIARREGLRSLFQGNGAQMARIFPYSAVQFTSFELYKHQLPRVTPFRQDSHLVRFVSGSMAGVTAVILTFPLDLVRTRLAFQTKEARIYRGITHALYKIGRKEGGIRGLYRGIMPSLVGMVPYAGFAFYSFEVTKHFCMNRLPRLTCQVQERADGSTSLVLNIPSKLVCGGMSGAVAQTFAYPLDVARRRMQLGSMSMDTKRFVGLGTVGTLRKVYREDGLVRGLYRGLSVNYLRAIPMVALSFTTNELLKQAFHLDTGVSTKDS